MNEYSKNYYDRYKNFDNSRLNSFIIRNLESLFEIESYLKVNVTIDIGCGTGKLIYRLKDYSEMAIGLDISPDALDIARQKNNGPFFILGDGLNLPVKDNICDICTCIYVLEHVERFDFLLKEIHRIMAFNGKVIFVTRNQKWTRFSLPFLKDATHVKEFTIRELKSLVSEYFYIKDIRPFSAFTSFGMFNPVLNMLVKPDISISAIKK